MVLGTYTARRLICSKLWLSPSSTWSAPKVAPAASRVFTLRRRSKKSEVRTSVELIPELYSSVVSPSVQSSVLISESGYVAFRLKATRSRPTAKPTSRSGPVSCE